MNKKLFVRNLSWSVTENDLYDLFGQVGSVESVKIPTRREDGKPRGFAFIEMSSADEAEQAIRQHNGVMLQDRDIVVTFQDDSQAQSRGPAITKNPKLFVRNIGQSVTEIELQDVFAQVGAVISARIPTDRDTGANKGFAFVEMSSADEAEQAIEQLQNTPLAGESLMINYQDPNRQKRSPRQGGGYDRGGYNRGQSNEYAGNRW